MTWRDSARPDAETWAIVRRAVLVRDGYRCTACRKAGRLEVDHIRPMYKGGSVLDMGNLQALCRACHIEKTRTESTAPERREWREYVKGFSRPQRPAHS